MAKKQLNDDDYVDFLKKIRKDLSKIEDRLSITDPEDLHREVPTRLSRFAIMSTRRSNTSLIITLTIPAKWDLTFNIKE